MDKNGTNYKPGEVKVERKPFEEPKLTYMKPKLSKQGKVNQVTQSFFGSFSP